MSEEQRRPRRSDQARRSTQVSSGVKYLSTQLKEVAMRIAFVALLVLTVASMFGAVIWALASQTG